MVQENYKLEMTDISKHFGGVKALDHVSLNVKPGEILALIGENGAGKSTLMKVLSGAYHADSGSIRIDGAEQKIDTPKDARDLGIAVIYQEFTLAPDLSVAENIYIDRLTRGKKTIHWDELNRDAAAQLERLGFGNINPSARCGDLSTAYQQIVEICKCLSRDAKILVFDEPTAVLTFTEIRRLFDIIRKLQQQGVSIIYISHRLEEIFELSQRITVLKDGRTVGTVDTASIDREQLVSMMVGRKISDMYPKRGAKIGKTVLKVEHLSAGKAVRDVSFEVHEGEVLGFNGLVGAGRTETMRAIFGADKRDGGTVTYLGKKVSWKNPRESIEAGFGMLPEDRKGEGLVLGQSIRMNTTLANLSHRTKNGIINNREEKEYVRKVLASINTKYGSTEDPCSSLSGGNQQKVALAKWIVADCRCIVFDEPTRGVDVGAKTEIYRVINGLAEKGVAIILVSSEMTEIIGMCDRCIVMRGGMVSGEISKEDMNENTLIRYSMGLAGTEGNTKS